MPFGEKKRDKHAGMFGSKERADHDAQVAQDPAPAARAAKSLKLLADLERGLLSATAGGPISMAEVQRPYETRIAEPAAAAAPRHPDLRDRSEREAQVRKNGKDERDRVGRDESQRAPQPPRQHSSGNSVAFQKHFVISAIEGNLRKVRRALENGAQVNLRAEILVSFHDSILEIARFGWSPETSDEDDRVFSTHKRCTALYAAAQSGHGHIVDFLLSAKADINKVTGDIDMVEASPYAGGEKDHVNGDQATPLYIAARVGHAEMVQQLLRCGATIDQARGSNREFNDGGTSWHSPPYSSSRVLQRESKPIEQVETGPDTPLHAAVRNGWLPIISLLLQGKANIHATFRMRWKFRGASPGRTSDYKRFDTGFTALHLAVLAGNTDVVRLLLTHKAGVNTASDKTESTALCLAVQKSNRAIMNLLLDCGADPNLGYALLRCVENADCMELVQVLLQRGAHFSCQFRLRSPLKYALAHGPVELVELLLVRKADPNEQSPLSAAMGLDVQDDHSKSPWINGDFLPRPVLGMDGVWKHPVHGTSFGPKADFLRRNNHRDSIVKLLLEHKATLTNEIQAAHPFFCKSMETWSQMEEV